jgi:hypothetical protein
MILVSLYIQPLIEFPAKLRPFFNQCLFEESFCLKLSPAACHGLVRGVSPRHHRDNSLCENYS